MRSGTSVGGIGVAVGVGVAVGDGVEVGTGVGVGRGVAVGSGVGVAGLLHATASVSTATIARYSLTRQLPRRGLLMATTSVTELLSHSIARR